MPCRFSLLFVYWRKDVDNVCMNRMPWLQISASSRAKFGDYVAPRDKLMEVAKISTVDNMSI